MIAKSADLTRARRQALGHDAVRFARSFRRPDLGVPAGAGQRPGDRLATSLVGSVEVVPPGPGLIKRCPRGDLAQKLIIVGIAGRQLRWHRAADRIGEEDGHAVIGSLACLGMPALARSRCSVRAVGRSVPVHVRRPDQVRAVAEPVSPLGETISLACRGHAVPGYLAGGLAAEAIASGGQGRSAKDPALAGCEKADANFCHKDMRLPFRSGHRRVGAPLTWPCDAGRGSGFSRSPP